jgi:hypothetical protein
MRHSYVNPSAVCGHRFPFQLDMSHILHPSHSQKAESETLRLFGSQVNGHGIAFNNAHRIPDQRILLKYGEVQIHQGYASFAKNLST